MIQRTAFLLVVSLVLLPAGSTAARPEKLVPLIFNTIQQGDVLIIEGEDLVLEGDEPIVTVDDQELALKDYSSDTKIEAYLPTPALAAGSYLLTVTPGQDLKELTTFDVAIEYSPSSHLHDDRYFTESELQTSGASVLHWNNLIGVPSGLQDGDDIGAYAAGNQLTLSGFTFNVIEGAGSGLDADTLDGLHANEIGGDLSNVITVARSGGNFTSIQSALDSITDNSDTNRYLIRVAPGTYYEKVFMKSWVDIEGSGEGITKITSTGGVSNTTSGLTVRGAPDTELRFLTVENTGGGLYAIAIHCFRGPIDLLHVTAIASGGTSSQAILASATANVLMRDVTAHSTGGGSYSYGVYNSSSFIVADGLTAYSTGGTVLTIGVFSSGEQTTLDLNRARIEARGPGPYVVGVNNQESSATIFNSIVVARGGTTNYGIYNSGSGGNRVVQVSGSQVEGTQKSVMHDNNYRTRLAVSMLSGGPVDVSAGGSAICAGVYDENYVFFTSTCP